MSRKLTKKKKGKKKKSLPKPKTQTMDEILQKLKAYIAGTLKLDRTELNDMQDVILEGLKLERPNESWIIREYNGKRFIVEEYRRIPPAADDSTC